MKEDVVDQLALEIQNHLRWEDPLDQLPRLRGDGTHSWLTHRIEVFIDFPWRNVVGHGAQTFRHYFSLSNYIRAHQKKVKKKAALVLTTREGRQEGLVSTHPDYDIFIVNIVQYKGLTKSDVATAYLAGLSGAPIVNLESISPEKIVAALDSLKEAQTFRDWLGKHPEFADIWSVEDGLSAVTTEQLVRQLYDRLAELNESDIKHLLDLTESGNFPMSVLGAATMAKRKKVVDQFRSELELDRWKEPTDWQPFFKEHSWIFGHGLLYHFLEPVEDQVLVGGKNMANVGGLVGDYAVRTSGDNASFLAIVDIKVPSAVLMGSEYRNKCYGIHGDLSGPVAQVIGLCDHWNREGSKSEVNVERAAEEGWNTAQPRGILVIGHSKTLDSKEKKRSFELFRRHLHGIEILTFDELLRRAEALVAPDGSLA